MNPFLQALLARYSGAEPTPPPDPAQQFVDAGNSGQFIGGYGIPGWGTENGFDNTVPPQQQPDFLGLLQQLGDSAYKGAQGVGQSIRQGVGQGVDQLGQWLASLGRVQESAPAQPHVPVRGLPREF